MARYLTVRIFAAARLRPKQSPDVKNAIHLRAICEPRTAATILKLDMSVDANPGCHGGCSGSGSGSGSALPVDIL